MEYTKNYHLPQWAEEDRILMEDFNAMCGAIESGITGAQGAAETAQETADTAMELGEAAVQFIEGNANCLIATGSYAGTGQFGGGNANSLSFDFRPLAVIVMDRENANVPVILMRGCSSANPGTGHALYPVTWGEKSVSWYSDNDQYTQCNGLNVTYQYVAIGYRTA